MSESHRGKPLAQVGHRLQAGSHKESLTRAGKSRSSAGARLCRDASGRSKPGGVTVNSPGISKITSASGLRGQQFIEPRKQPRREFRDEFVGRNR